MARKLGRRPPKNAPALRLASFLTGLIPTHPAAADHFSLIVRWLLGGNDLFGTCGPTDLANYVKLVYKYATGEDITVTDPAIFDLYRRSGNPHFDPTTGADDNGVDMQTMLEAFHSGGLEITHADGTTEVVKPVAFAKVDASNLDEVRAAISIFGGVNLGLDLEVAQQGQTDNGLWDYVYRSGEWGGHATLAGLYTSVTSKGRSDISLITWAMVVGTTDAFMAHQLEEVWVAILPVQLAHPAFQQGVDLEAFAAAYQELTDRPLPLPGPTPDPAPVPPAPTDWLAALIAWLRNLIEQIKQLIKSLGGTP